MTQTQFRAQIDDYTNRVLGVVKAKYGLKDKSDALNKFAQLCGEQFVEKEVSSEFIEDVLSTIENHKKKSLKRKMSAKELDML